MSKRTSCTRPAIPTSSKRSPTARESPSSCPWGSIDQRRITSFRLFCHSVPYSSPSSVFQNQNQNQNQNQFYYPVESSQVHSKHNRQTRRYYQLIQLLALI